MKMSKHHAAMAKHHAAMASAHEKMSAYMSKQEVEEPTETHAPLTPQSRSRRAFGPDAHGDDVSKKLMKSSSVYKL